MPKLVTRSSDWKDRPADQGKVTELVVDGFIDAANYSTFEKGLEQAYEGGARFLILDFSRVHYINSTGISALVRFYEQLRTRDGILCLANVVKPVGLSMHLLGVTSFLPFLKDMEAARQYVRDYQPGVLPAQPAMADGEVPATEAGAEAPAPDLTLEGMPLKIPLRRRGAPGLEKSRVLVITPSTNRFTRILRLRFNRFNGDYHLLHSVREALDRYEELSPDLVVVDDRCDPKGEFVSRVKIQKERSLTSIIKLYGDQRDVESEVDFKIWENDYLVEPFELLELFSLTEAELLRVPKDKKVLQQQVHFEFRTTPENVEKACKLSDLVIRQSVGIQEDATALYAAVKEGIDNAVVHGNGSDPGKCIEVNILVDQKKITVLVEDEGDGFDYDYYLQRLDDKEAFEKAKKRILEEGARGGLGILLMYKCSDRLDYSGDGNILRLEKNI